jgi:hypothetical protein
MPLRDHLNIGKNGTEIIRHLTRFLAAYNVLNQVTVGQILMAASKYGAPELIIHGVIKTAIDSLSSSSVISNETTVIEALEILQEKRTCQISSHLKPLDDTINELNEDEKNDTVQNVLADVLDEKLWEKLNKSFKKVMLKENVDVDDIDEADIDVADMKVNEFISTVWRPFKTNYLWRVLPKQFVKFLMALTDESLWVWQVGPQSELFPEEVMDLWKKAYCINISTGEQGESIEEVSNVFIRDSLSMFQAMFMQENISHVMFEFGSNFKRCKTNRVISSLMIRSKTEALKYVKMFGFNRPERFLNDDFSPSMWSTTQVTELAKLTNADSKAKYKKTNERRRKKVFFIPLFDVTDDDVEERLKLFKFFERST